MSCEEVHLYKWYPQCAIMCLSGLQHCFLSELVTEICFDSMMNRLGTTNRNS